MRPLSFIGSCRCKSFYRSCALWKGKQQFSGCANSYENRCTTSFYCRSIKGRLCCWYFSDSSTSTKATSWAWKACKWVTNKQSAIFADPRPNQFYEAGGRTDQGTPLVIIISPVSYVIYSKKPLLHQMWGQVARSHFSIKWYTSPRIEGRAEPSGGTSCSIWDYSLQFQFAAESELKDVQAYWWHPRLQYLFISKSILTCRIRGQCYPILVYQKKLMQRRSLSKVRRQ